MKYTITAILVLIPLLGAADGKPPNNNHPVDGPNLSASAESVSVAGAAAVAQAGDSTSSSVSGSTVGDTTSSVGDVTVGGDDLSTRSEASNSGISYHNEYPRQAPGVALAIPSSTVDCVVGFGGGGSNKSGSLLGGFGWVSRDCKAAKLFETFAGLGLYQPAAKSFCARKNHWRPFGGVSECEASIVQSLIDAATPEPQRIIRIRADHARACESRPKIGGPAVIREIQDDGTILVYECEELGREPS